MLYNRKQRSKNPIDIVKFDRVETGAIFKQYDVNTSILELELVNNGEPIQIDNSFKIYVTVRTLKSLTQNSLYRYLDKQEKNDLRVLLRAEKKKARDASNLVTVYISPLALTFSGDMVCEVILVDEKKQQRITSQEFTLKIEPSLTPNQTSDIKYSVIEDMDGTFITDAEELKFLATDGSGGYRLTFSGDEVENILQTIKDFKPEENKENIGNLVSKDIELEKKINENANNINNNLSSINQLNSLSQNFKNEIESLKEYDNNNDKDILSIKSDISDIQKYNKNNDENISNINVNIKKFENYHANNDKKISFLDSEISNLKGYNSSNDINIKNINSKLNDIQDYKNENDKNLVNINSSILSLQNATSKINTSINETNKIVSDYIAKNDNEIYLINQSLSNNSLKLDQSINKIEKDFDDLKHSLVDNVRENSKNIEDIQLYMQKNDANISRVNSKMDNTISQLNNKTQDVLNRIKLHDIDIAKNNQLIVNNTNAINKNTQIVNSMKKNIENNTNLLNVIEKSLEEGEEKFTLLNTEIVNARVSTVGENFDTLEDRLNTEFNRIKNDINVSFITEDFKKSHNVKNTLDGVISDIIIKGKTIQNITPLNIIDASDASLFDHCYYEIKVEQKEDCIQFTQPDAHKYLVGGYNNTMLIPSTNYLHIADVEVVSNDGNDECSFLVQSMTQKNTKSIRCGRGIIATVGKSGTDVKTGNNAWIGIVMGSDNSTGANRQFKIYSMSSFVITEEEAQKPIDELLKTYKFKKDNILSFGSNKEVIKIKSSNGKESCIKNINLSDLGFERGLNSIKETIYDIIDYKNKQSIKRIGLYKFNGTEELRNFETDGNYSKCSIENFPKIKMGTRNIVCNVLKEMADTTGVTSQTEYIASVNSPEWSLLICVKTSRLKENNLNGIKEWLFKSGAEMLFELNEPEITPIKTNLTLKSYNNETNVGFEEDFPVGEVSFLVPCDSNKIITCLKNENEKILTENKKIKNNLEEHYIDSLKQSLDSDFRIMNLEMAIAPNQRSVSLFGLKAKTPYEMIKEIISYGDYDKEDLLFKAKIYCKNHRMTEKEYKEIEYLLQ